MFNPAYAFLLNMWIMRKLDEVYLDAMVARGYISNEEKAMIMMAPQVEPVVTTTTTVY